MLLAKYRIITNNNHFQIIFFKALLVTSSGSIYHTIIMDEIHQRTLQEERDKNNLAWLISAQSSDKRGNALRKTIENSNKLQKLDYSETNLYTV